MEDTEEIYDIYHNGLFCRARYRSGGWNWNIPIGIADHHHFILGMEAMGKGSDQGKMIQAEHICFLLVIAFILPVVITLMVWKMFFEKNAKRLKGINGLQKNIKLKEKGAIINDKQPFGEVRIPVMLLTISSLIFTLITAMFGIGYNRNTMQLEFFDLSHWDPITSNIINPMQQYPWFCWIAFYVGYYFLLMAIVYLWFDYCRWKWLNIPIEFRIEHKKIKEKKMFPMNGREH